MTLNEVMAEFNWNQSKAAEALKVHRSTLNKYLKDLSGEKHFIKDVNGEKRLFTLRGKAA